VAKVHICCKKYHFYNLIELQHAYLIKHGAAKILHYNHCHKELLEMEKHMSVMKQYMEKQGLRTKEAARSGKKKDGQER
jgi:hypothetical protein